MHQNLQPEVNNQNLYPWRRPRTLPRMPDNFPTSPTPLQQHQMALAQSAKTTSVVPVSSVIGPVKLNWAQHPSKMPVPPPRRKKKLSFSGLKDTLRNIVNTGHYKNQQSHEPVYATIIKPNAVNATGIIGNNNRTVIGNNGKQANGSIPSAFRPLPALPPNEPDDNAGQV